MNAPFAIIFLALQSRIAGQVPAIKYIDQDIGQLKQPRPPVSWPCVLLDFEDFTCTNLAGNVQVATGTIVLRLGFAPWSGTAQYTPGTSAAQALGYYELEWALHKTLQGWHPGPEFGALTRTATTTQKRTDSYRVREIRYTLSFEDYSAHKTQGYAPAVVLVHSEF